LSQACSQGGSTSVADYLTLLRLLLPKVFPEHGEKLFASVFSICTRTLAAVKEFVASNEPNRNIDVISILDSVNFCLKILKKSKQFTENRRTLIGLFEALVVTVKPEFPYKWRTLEGYIEMLGQLRQILADT